MKHRCACRIAFSVFMRLFLCFGAVALIAGSMAARGRVPEPFVAPLLGQASSPDYTIRQYDLVIEPDFAAKTLALFCSITIDNPGLADAFEFGLNDFYKSVDVTSPSAPLIVKREAGAILVTLEKPAASLRLDFKLSGSPGQSQSEERAVIDDQSLFLIWSDRFYPNDFDHWSPVRTTIVLPAGFEVIAPGREIESSPAGRPGGLVRHVFASSGPEVNYSVFADRRWVKSERTVHGIRIETLLHPQGAKFADQIFRTSGEILKFFSDTFCPYPFDQFALVTIEGIYARRAFSNFVGYEPAYIEKEFTTTGFDAHETSLLWWFYTIRGSGPGGYQWIEGFGDYAEFLYDEHAGRPIPKIFRTFRDEYLAAAPEKDYLWSELRGNTDQAFIHGKYPWLMHLVRYVIGDAPFARAMKFLFERWKFRTLSMDEFVAALEQGSGASLAWFRDEWLARRGVPVMALKWDAHQAEGGGFMVSGMIDQTGALYHLPVEIGIRTASGVRVEKVAVAEKVTSFSFRSKERPGDVVLDPNGWILMKKVRQ